jgi:hypothetical protein
MQFYKIVVGRKSSVGIEIAEDLRESRCHQQWLGIKPEPE